MKGDREIGDGLLHPIGSSRDPTSLSLNLLGCDFEATANVLDRVEILVALANQSLSNREL
jgi:hypothetical protein